MTYFFYYPRSKSLNASFERWIVLYSIMPANMAAFYLHFHADQLISKNKFMNLLFSNFYEEYMMKIKKIEDVASSVMEKLDLDSSQVYEFSILYQSKMNLTNDKYFTSNITFGLNKSNDYIFESMLDNLKYQSSSQYFRDLVTDYLAYPQYKREQIIFKDTVEIIKQSIIDQKQIKLRLDKDV